MTVRAPLKTMALISYESGSQGVLRGQCLNISEGGALIESFFHPSFIQASRASLIISLPLYPDFHHWGLEKIRGMGMGMEAFFDRQTIRLQAQPVRIQGGKVGHRFCQLSKMAKEEIGKYVTRFSQNTLFLLHLLEARGPDREDLETLKMLISLLGHDKNQDLTLLRQKILHDYQGLMNT